ncbi:MAG: R.Pab1 family restriction endonuclease [Deltaproteobacteria bacterium]|nr:R.Pab1 family restriction endonuclease [Deltaproteobacteria bacterium]
MDWTIKENSILLTIPATNAGKFRFKKRKNRLDFGEIFSTRECPFDDQTYLEWQIGYDVPVKEVEDGKKETKLTSKHFVGSNGKTKYPYELSEIFYKAMELEFITKKEVENLLNEIGSYKSFIDEKTITVEHHSQITINGINFEETSIKLPTLFMIETLDETQIEVSIQKQQYASGVQPMVYFCVPLKAFKNSSDLFGKSSVSGDKLVYVINKTNVLNFIDMMKVFGMASKRHNHDIIKILETLLEIIDT